MLQTFEAGEEVESLKTVHTEQPRSTHTEAAPAHLQEESLTPPVSGKEETVSQTEDSSLSSVEKEDFSAPIAAEEESLLLDFEGESVSGNPSVTNTPVLLREPIRAESAPISESQLFTDDSSFVDKRGVDNTVITSEPKPVVLPVLNTESPRAQEDSIVRGIVREKALLAEKPVLEDKEEAKVPVEKPLAEEKQEEKVVVEIQKPEVKKDIVKEEVPGACEGNQHCTSPPDKDQLLETVNLTLTNIMEKAGKNTIIIITKLGFADDNFKQKFELKMNCRHDNGKKITILTKCYVN